MGRAGGWPVKLLAAVCDYKPVIPVNDADHICNNYSGNVWTCPAIATCICAGSFFPYVTTCYEAIQALLGELDRKAPQMRDLSWVDDEAYLFAGKQSDRPLTVPTLNNLVKDWCRKVNLKGNYGSHSLRKTWGYMQRTKQNTPIPLLMRAFGHASQQQILAYLSIQAEEIESIYTSLEL